MFEWILLLTPFEDVLQTAAVANGQLVAWIFGLAKLASG